MVASLPLSLRGTPYVCAAFHPLVVCCAAPCLQCCNGHTPGAGSSFPLAPGRKFVFISLPFSGPLCSMIHVRHPRSRVLLLFYYASTNASSKVSLLPPLASRHFRDRFPVPGSTTPSAIN
uniref:Putative secreted protein n=1 Tax=Anopheles darlingi TaxID=43151 RepID=A0A2M4D0V5_ANODA